jgi:hypothetical protein
LGRAKLVGSELPPHELAQVGKRVLHGEVKCENRSLP